MNTPITLHHRQDTVEGLQFTGSYESATVIAHFMDANKAYYGAFRDFGVVYSHSTSEPPQLELTLGDDRYELSTGDWVIKDNGLLSVCHYGDFDLRYVTGIEKIKLEAGMD